MVDAHRALYERLSIPRAAAGGPPVRQSSAVR
jgi:hypothetical protein